MFCFQGGFMLQLVAEGTRSTGTDPAVIQVCYVGTLEGNEQIPMKLIITYKIILRMIKIFTYTVQCTIVQYKYSEADC